jgi:hypothetical protein
MSTDKPLQDIFNTVRIPVTDSIVSVENTTPYFNTSYNTAGFDYSGYWNCYPQFFSDRSQNQYSSQFDTWITKRGGSTGPVNLASLGSGNNLTCACIIPITTLDDCYVMAVFDSTGDVDLFTGGTQIGWRIIQYKAQAATAIQIGTIIGNITDNIYLTEITVGGVPTLAVSWSNQAETAFGGAYATGDIATNTFTAATLTVISDVHFPANVAAQGIRGPFVYQNGWTYIASKLTAGIYNSELNSIISWYSTMVVLSQAYADQLVGLTRYKNHIVAVGENSIEFYNATVAGAGTATNPKSPLQATDQAFIKSGAPHAKSILAFDDTFYWWSRSDAGKFGLYKLDGYTPVKVSTLRDDLLAAATPEVLGNSPELYYLQDNGKQHIITTILACPNLLFFANKQNALGTFPTGQPTTVGAAYPGDPWLLNTSEFASGGYLCFDIATGNSWIYSNSASPGAFPLYAQSFPPSVPGSASTATTVLMAFSKGAPRSVVGTANYGYRVAQVDARQSQTGIYNATFFYDTDPTGGSTKAITCGIQFNVWDWGTEKRKRIHKFKVLSRQFGLSSSATNNYTWVVYNKTDGNLGDGNSRNTTYALFVRPIIQAYNIARTYLNNLGAARKWYFAIINKNDGNWACKGIELDISQGTS